VAPLARAENVTTPAAEPPPPCAVGEQPSTGYPDGGEPIRETMGKPAYHPEPQPKPPKPPKPTKELQGK
jgi:hypothetical protein